jgi:single-stranded-DNA-specific exonuclease
MTLSAPSSAEERAWKLRPLDAALAQRLSAEGGWPEFTGRLLAARGFTDADSARIFLAADLKDVHAPLGLSGMAAAVERLKVAVALRQKVGILGDYDVDGVTSTALLLKLFHLLGVACEAYIPDRILEGYGPNAGALQKLKDGGASVVVTVDCGVTAVPEALAARAMGLDLIITDHHVAGPVLPDALALVNPKTSPDYPYSMLGGVGVAYKLAQALLEALQHPRKDEFLDHMLELVALGTICDVAPLDDENRALVKAGLARMRLGRWMGLRSLAKAAGVDLTQADAGQMGFYLGPRINAGGRIGDAFLGVKLLMTKDPEESRALAAALHNENKTRQGLEKAALEQAMVMAEIEMARGVLGLVLWHKDWHPGVVGLVASRLLEKYHRPVFALAVQDGIGKGSGRSRRPFHLVDALQACSIHLKKFGGHEFAAGCTIEEGCLPAFKEAFLARTAGLTAADLLPELNVDLELRFWEITPKAMHQIETLEPFGMKNPRPVFAARGLKLLAGTRAVGGEGEHLKLDLEQDGVRLGGIAFRQGPKLAMLAAAGKVDAAFSLGWNEWQGTRSLQLEVKDIRPSKD